MKTKLSVFVKRGINNEVLNVEGISDCYSEVQVSIPIIEITSELVAKALETDEYLAKKFLDAKITGISFCEQGEAKDLVGIYGDYKYSIEEVEIELN